MSVSPRVSFIILSYNYEKYILKTIQSILEQTFSDFEVVVIDDASSDRSCQVVRSFGDPRIRLYVNEQNLGGAASYNRAVGLCRGEYLVNLDSDDWIDPRKTEIQLKTFEKNQSLDILGTYISCVDAIGNKHSRSAEVETWTNRPHDFNVVDTWIGNNYICHSSTMIRRSVHERIGLDEPTMVRAPDYELWTRALYKDCRFGVVQQPLTFYRLHDGTVTHGDPQGAFLEVSYLTLKNIIPIIEKRATFDCFCRIIDWMISHEQFVACRPEERYRLLGAMLTSPPSDNFAVFREMIFGHRGDPALASAGQRSLVAFTLYVDKVDKFVEARDFWHTQSDNWEREYKRSKEQQVAEALEWEREQAAKDASLAAKDASLAVKDASLAAKDASLAVKDASLAAKDASLAAKDASLLEQQRELEIFRTSKLQRLRSTLLYETLSSRKALKIIYLITALATPEPVRSRLRPFVHRLKRRFDSTAQPEPRTEKLRQKKWPGNRPLISVVIPCFNYGRYVEGAVDSVLSQTFQDFEIILVDGGSTDDTPHILQVLQKPKTRIYSRSERHLLGDNRDFGISRARGTYICCLDADDKLRPTYLEKALFLLETYQYDIVSPSVQCFGNSDLLWQVPARPSLEQITQANQFSVVAVFRKDLWKKAGGYHDQGSGNAYVYEDWKLWVRMMALGARAINIDEALMLYRVHDASLSNDPHTRPWKEHLRDILKFNEKHLTRKNHLLSAKRNAAVIHVDDPYLNLVASYRKQPKKPAILLALPYVITGGADTVFLEMGKHLVENDFDLSIVTTVPTEASFGDNTDRYEAITKQVYHLYKFLDEETKWKDFLFYLIESRSVDVLLLAGSSYVYSLLPQIKKRFPRLKIVDHLFNEHGHIENNRKHRDLIDTHVVVNDLLKGILIDRFAETEDRIRVIKPGVDVKGKFNPDNLSEDELLPPGILPPNKFLVFFVGRFSEEKCPEKFVEMAHLLRDDASIHFVMLGSGPEYLRVKEKISALGLDDRIYAPGTVSDVRPYLRLADVLVIPSAVEGLPVTMMEGMALGVPVIASAVGGVPSVIRDGFNGFVCEPSDIEGFVRNIRQIAGDESLRKVIRVNAREYALRHLSVHETNRQYSDLFSELVETEHRQSRTAANVG